MIIGYEIGIAVDNGIPARMSITFLIDNQRIITPRPTWTAKSDNAAVASRMSM